MKTIVLTETIIKNNWRYIQHDEFFDAEKYTTVESFLEDARKGNCKVGGVALVIRNKLPAL